MLVDQPQRLLQSINYVFHKNTAENAYATLFFAEYDDAARRLRYANCGHLPALLLRDSKVDRLEATATVVGLFPEWDCSVCERTLSSGDMLAVYTDGITEAFNQDDEEFGEGRLIDALKTYRELPPQAIIANIVDEVRRFSPHEQHDDITLTIAKCR
jgi:serine phosphatase RsbU (regulator of sigma subunit)